MSEIKTTVFVCRRGSTTTDTVKVQLELPRRILDAYKDKAKASNYTPKQIMENMLTNWIDGVSE